MSHLQIDSINLEVVHVNFFAILQMLICCLLFVLQGLKESEPHADFNGYVIYSRAVDKRETLVIIMDNFCLFCIKRLCCHPSSELSRRGISDEGSQHMVSMRNKKNYHQILPLI